MSSRADLILETVSREVESVGAKAFAKFFTLLLFILGLVVGSPIVWLVAQTDLSDVAAQLIAGVVVPVVGVLAALGANRFAYQAQDNYYAQATQIIGTF